MQRMGSRIGGVMRGIGAAALLSSQSAQSDEALLPPGTTLGQFPVSSIPTLRNAVATGIVSDITPDPALVPSNTFRWLLVKTDSGLALTLPENYTGAVQHYGQQEKFFIRFDCNTGLPEISFDCITWRPHTDSTPVNISREEQTTILSISADLQALNTLQAQQQALATTLAAKEDELLQAEDLLGQVQTQYENSVTDLAITDSNRINQEIQKNGLELNIKPEAQLRTDVHPTVQSTTLSDDSKNTNTQSALATYDASASIQHMPSPVPAPPNNIIIPTPSEVQTTVNLLTQELSRLQTQINEVSAQITAKQNEITATQNSIDTKQAALDPIEAQLQQYLIDYNYWDSEVVRLRALRDDAETEKDSLKSSYATQRTRLMNEGSRSDVPSDLDTSNISSQISALKTQIMNEYNAIAIATTSLPADITTNNLSDIKGSILTRLDSSYYYHSDFYSLSKSYPATLRVYCKFKGSTSYTLSDTSYTAINGSHRLGLINNTIKPLYNKFCDYIFVDKVLETTKDNYLTAKDEYTTYKDQAGDATWERIYASNNINSAGPLVDQYKAELAILTAQKATLTQQKSDLDALKNIKAQLQALYNRVKTILNQLQTHIASHGTITQEIANLVALAQSLETEIADLEIVIAETEGNIADLETQVGSLSDDITAINTSLTAREQALLATLSSIATVIPQDSFSRNGAILTPSSEALKYFSDGFRTGRNARTIAGLPVKWMIQYFHDGTNDLSTNIYPATASVQYLINGRAYYTEGQKMNNFAHKELVNGYLEEVLTKLNTCIALLNQYPNNSSTGIETFLSDLKAQIAGLQASQSPNATIRNHVTATNTLTKKTLLQGGSYALFENLMANNAVFSLKIEEITTLMAQKANIGGGTDAMNDLRHMVTTILARAFAEQLMFSGTDGLNLYVNWEQDALSFINGLGDTAIWDKQFDVNADWSIDVHGNKYKFGLYHPGGANNSLYDPPATLFMMYSPDGVNTQVLGPVTVSSGAEADAMKARWQQELLKLKRMHADYSGGAYDIFRGTNERGEYVYWGKYATTNGSTLLGTSFGNSAAGVESTVKNNILNSRIRSSIGVRVILPKGMDDIRKAEQYLLSLQSKYLYQISGISSKNGIRIDIDSLDTLAEINSIRLGIISKIETPGFISSLPQQDVDYLFNLRNQLMQGIANNLSEQGGYWQIQPGKDAFAALRVLMVEFIGTLMQSASIDAYRDSTIPFQSQEYYDSMNQVFQDQYTTFGNATQLLTQEILDAAYGDDFYYLNTGNPPVGYDIMYYASMFLPGPGEGAFALKSAGTLARVAVKTGSKLETQLFREVAPGIVRQVAEDGRITEIVNGLAHRASPEVVTMESVFHSRIGTFAQSDINTILSKDPAVVADEIYKIARDKTGRMVFLDKGTVYVNENKKGTGFDHIIKQVNKDGPNNNITRYELLKKDGFILDGEDVEDLIDKILDQYISAIPVPGENKIIYTATINGQDIIMSTSDGGKIITIVPLN